MAQVRVGYWIFKAASKLAEEVACIDTDQVLIDEDAETIIIQDKDGNRLAGIVQDQPIIG